MNIFSLQARPTKGFTLVEILIVISIIGILAAAVLIGLGPIQRRGRDTRRISDLRQVEHALGLYYNKCGYYPGTAPAPDCTGYTDLGSDWPTLQGVLISSGIGVTQVPNDPRSGVSYGYGSDGSGYVLGALLEDNSTSVLTDDVDGTVFGVDCGSGGAGTDQVYCVQF